MSSKDFNHLSLPSLQLSQEFVESMKIFQDASTQLAESMKPLFQFQEKFSKDLLDAYRPLLDIQSNLIKELNETFQSNSHLVDIHKSMSVKISESISSIFQGHSELFEYIHNDPKLLNLKLSSETSERFLTVTSETLTEAEEATLLKENLNHSIKVVDSLANNQSPMTFETAYKIIGLLIPFVIFLIQLHLSNIHQAEIKNYLEEKNRYIEEIRDLQREQVELLKKTTSE